MTETTFEKEVMSKLDRVEKTMNQILDYIEDSKLTAQEKQLLQESIDEEKKGNLTSAKDLRKKLGL